VVVVLIELRFLVLYEESHAFTGTASESVYSKNWRTFMMDVTDV
jgi:hypothetical protein